MSEQEHIELIDEAFAGFRASVAPSVPSVDAAAVQKKVIRRRRMHTTAFSVLAALAIAVPIAAYAASTRGGQGPPTPADSAGPVVLPTAVATSEVPPTSAPPSVAPLDGRLTVSQLTMGNRDMPAWGADWPLCPSGSVVLNPPDGLAMLRDQISLFVGDIAHTNLDGDEAPETAAVIKCRNPSRGDGETSRIVGFDRGADGRIVTLGSIIVMKRGDRVAEMVTRPRGGITVKVISSPVFAWDLLEFAWDGRKLSSVPWDKQTAGFFEHETFLPHKVRVPSWGSGLEHCPSGDVELNARPGLGSSSIANINIDGDDAFEAAVLVRCGETGGASTVHQLLVYERNASGKIVLVGKVVEEGVNRSLGMIQDVTASPSGRTLLVWITPPGGDISEKKYREFTWDGSKFVEARS